MPNFADIVIPPNNFKTYSFRLECSEDYTAFVVEADKRNVKIVTTEFYLFRVEGMSGAAGPDAYAEFVSEASLEELRDVLRGVADSHVALQTLRQAPLKDNSLKRDYDLH